MAKISHSLVSILATVHSHGKDPRQSLITILAVFLSLPSHGNEPDTHSYPFFRPFFPSPPMEKNSENQSSPLLMSSLSCLVLENKRDKEGTKGFRRKDQKTLDYRYFMLNVSTVRLRLDCTLLTLFKRTATGQFGVVYIEYK